MDMKVPTLTKSWILVGALVLGGAGAANAGHYHEKDGATQKPYGPREYPGASQGTDYGAGGNGMDQRYRDSRQPDSSRYDGVDRYSADGSYDRSGNDGTGPKLKGRY